MLLNAYLGVFSAVIVSWTNPLAVPSAQKDECLGDTGF